MLYFKGDRLAKNIEAVDIEQATFVQETMSRQRSDSLAYYFENFRNTSTGNIMSMAQWSIGSNSIIISSMLISVLSTSRFELYNYLKRLLYDQ